MCPPGIVDELINVHNYYTSCNCKHKSVQFDIYEQNICMSIPDVDIIFIYITVIVEQYQFKLTVYLQVQSKVYNNFLKVLMKPTDE